MTVPISGLTDRLTVDEHGIWRAARTSPVSYPEIGNQMCFELEDASFWFRHRNRCITATVKRHPPAGPILDVGGGNGYVSQGLIEAGYEAVLLEPGPVGAFNARTRRRLPVVICAAMEDAGIRARSIPAIGLFDVLEHIEDDRSFLQSAHALLVAGGLLYLTVPAHPWLWSLSDVFALHKRRYDCARLHDLLGPAYDVVYFTYFFSVLALPVLLFRAAPYRLGLSKLSHSLMPETEHGIEGGLMVRAIGTFLDREAKAIGRGETSSLGTSCLVVARTRE